MASENLKNTVHHFDSKDETRKIFYQKYHNPSLTTQGNLLITHGLGEHSDAYAHVIKAIATELPLDVYAWDLAGHGKSSGQRGYVGHISWFQKDLRQMISIIAKESNNAPIHLLSHSLGGLITLSIEDSENWKTWNIKSLTLSNPCTQLNFQPPKWKSLGAKFLTQMAPRLTLGNEIKPQDLASDTDYLKEHAADPLRHKSVSPRLFLGMLELMDQLKPCITDLPTLGLLSPKDPICSASQSSQILKNRAQLIFFEKSMHEVLNDVEKTKAISKFKEFLNENL